MSLRETVNAFGRDVSAHFKRDSYCTFAAAEETEGFVDTSAELDGSRGIAFLCDGILINFDGITQRLNYEDIKETEIIESYESDYADELLIKGRTTLRVSDFSVNKRFLRLLVDTLCLRYEHFSPDEREQCRKECRARSSARYAELDKAAAAVAKQVAERTAGKSTPRPASSAAGQSARNNRPAKPAASHTAQSLPDRRERSAQPEKAARPAQPAQATQPVQPEQSVRADTPTKPPVTQPHKTVEKTAAPAVPKPTPPLPELDIEEPRFSVPENHVPLEITEEKIEWLSGPRALDENGEISEHDIEGMSREETMSYLLSSINEINAPAEPRDEFAHEMTEMTESADEASLEAPSDPPETELPEESIPPVIEEIVPDDTENGGTPDNPDSPDIPDIPETAAEQSVSPFTIEPPSDDIYIKASRKIREICESGQLTREEIQTALKESLVSVAGQFAEITGEGAEIPRHIAPKIEELRTASESLERYFALGEDIAERVMFFMMYQMLSYSDRIVEAPETKERLKYFFKRYGPSGIMLSMLDMRVQ